MFQRLTWHDFALIRWWKRRIWKISTELQDVKSAAGIVWVQGEIFYFFLESYHHVWKTPSLDRCTLSPQSKLDGHGLIHLKAQPELCAAEETWTLHTHTHIEVCAYTFHLRSILTPLNHVMRSVSRHLDPPQADLDNGSAVLQHLTLSVSVCMCKMVICLAWPALSPRLFSGAASASNLLSRIQSLYGCSHR